MDLRIQGKRALVTGASVGIGRAIAEELAHEGCHVALLARGTEQLERAAGEIRAATNQKVLAIAGDASNTQAIQSMVERVNSEFGGIDILVNNAGSTPEDGIDSLDFDKWQQSVSLKLFGYARFAQCVLPQMRARKWGRIINIIGRSGHQPRPIYIAGGAINAALLNFTKALAEDCAKDNILVTGVNPGPIDTPRWQALRDAAARKRGVTAAAYDARAIAGVPVGRLGTSEEVSGLVAFLCSERATYITGEIINIDGGGTRCI